MGMFIRIVYLIALVTTVSCEECVESKCFSPNSSDINDGVTINYGCQNRGPRWYQCSLSIMSMSIVTNHQSDCVTLGNVPGIHQFCKSHVLGLLGPPAPPFTDDNDDDNEDIATENPDGKPITYKNEYITCIEIEVIVGVAIGSFVLGSFVTWAVITILAQCKHIQKELRDAQNSNSIRSIGRPRANCETSATSHQRLLSNGSAESCPSTTFGGQQNGQVRRQSEDTRHDDADSGRLFQMRQPLPAPPSHAVALQSYYTQPLDSVYTCSSDKDYQSIQGGSEHYAPVSEAVASASRTRCEAQSYYAKPIDSLYTCTSDKDYQSLQGGSEHYAPVSEGSDYTSLKSQRNAVVRADGTTKQTGESGGGNDYCSLESERGNPTEGAIYYPVSDGSNRDYTDLIGDDDVDTYCGINHRNESAMSDNRSITNQNGNKDTVKFQVNGFAGFEVSKRMGDSARPILEPLNDIQEVRNESDQRAAPMRKDARVDEIADGYEMVQTNTALTINREYSDTSNSNLSRGNGGGTLTGSIQSINTGSGGMHPGNSTGSVNRNSYAGVDFHDYDTCGGSIHEYFILEETASAL